MLLVHATGFCKETWEPVVDELRALGVDRELLAVDQRGHGDSAKPAPPFDWWDLAHDLLDVVGGHPVPLGVGHSSGAAALAMAELLAPGTFASLLLVEPIIFPPPYGRMEHNPMSVAALKRRDGFPSPEAAYENFHGRGPFAGWEDRALWAYVRGGLRSQGAEWRLKCPPEVEAEFYRAATAHGAWDRLGEIATRVVVAGGAASDSHPREFLHAQGARFADGTVRVVEGASHFVPMEQAAVVAAMAADLLG